MENNKINLDDVLNKIEVEAKKQFEEKFVGNGLKKEETSTIIYSANIISADEVAEISKRAAEMMLRSSGWDFLN